MFYKAEMSAYAQRAKPPLLLPFAGVILDELCLSKRRLKHLLCGETWRL